MQLVSFNRSVQRHTAPCPAKLAHATGKTAAPFTFLRDSFGVAMLCALGHGNGNRPAPPVATGLNP